MSTYYRAKDQTLVAVEGGDRIIMGRVGWAGDGPGTHHCVACCRVITMEDGRLVDGRSTVQFVWDHEGSGEWKLSHRRCP